MLHGFRSLGSTLKLCVLQENERTKDMIIEQRFHRAIIGQKGEKIKEIRDKFPEASLFLVLVFSSSPYISMGSVHL